MSLKSLFFFSAVAITYVCAWQDNNVAPIPEDWGSRPRFTNPRKLQEQSFRVRPAGASIKFKCPAVGEPSPTIVWLKNGQRFSRPEGSTTRRKDYSLYLGELTANDTGSYTCVVYNMWGSINWTFSVEVQERLSQGPQVVNVTGNQTVYEGDTVRLQCEVVSDLTPFVRWLKHYKVNGADVDSSGAPYAEVLQDSGDPQVRDPFQLVLTDVTATDAGQYTCLVGTIFGASHRSTWLRVLPRGYWVSP